MTEIAAIARTGEPITQEKMAADLRAIGVRPGMTLLVHTAMSRIGWVCGGARTCIETLIAATGATQHGGGTLIMPAQSSDLSDPAAWAHPAVPEHWWDSIRANTPPYDPALTPTRGLGIIAEQFRTWPGVQRSSHPQVSFTGLGQNAAAILATQPLEDPFGAESPLGVLQQLDAQVLMIGTGWDTCTALHLAERQANPNGPRYDDGAPMTVEGQRRWVRFSMPETDAENFPALGAKLDGSAIVRHGHVRMAQSRFFPLRDAVTMATALLRPDSARS